ncbi:MAG TPA: hypothetical protein DCP08_03125, partial [Chloroflexi bacterium]|nr:hypothetical protein [Chloroflexota bacterium]
DQVVWNTARGQLFVHSFATKPPNFLGDNFSPIVVLLAPFYWLWPDVRALLVIQTLALAAGGLPIYWLLTKRHHHLSFPVLLSYYLNPALHTINLSEFHPLALALPFISLAIYGLIERRYLLLALSILPVLLCREDMSLVVMALSTYLLFRRDGRRWGLALWSVALAWIGLVIVVQDRLVGHSMFRFYQEFSYLGGNPAEMLSRIVKNPQLLLTRLLSRERWGAICRLLLPTAFLPLLAPQILLLSLPIFGYLELSTSPHLHLLQSWSPSPLLPFLFFATSVGILRLGERLRRAALLLLLLASLGGYWAFSPAPLARGFDATRFVVTERAVQGHRLFQQIPARASLSAQSNLVPHLSHREAIYLFPNPQTAKAEYIILDTQGEKYPLSADQYEEFLNTLLSSPQYDLVSEIQGFLLFRRSDVADIQYPLSVKFKEGIALLGFNVAVEDSEGAFSEEVLPLRLGDKGGRVRLTLWWEALAPVEEDYTVFTHLLDGKGRFIEGHDSMPANGWRPTSGWRTGQVMRDIHYIPFEAGEDLGEIIIEVGFYDLETGRRLELEDGQDKVILGWLPE